MFLIIGTVTIAAGHYYLWLRLVRDVKLGETQRRIATGAIVALSIVFPGVLVLSRAVEFDTMWSVYMVGYTLMGISLLLMFWVFVLDLVQFVGQRLYRIRHNRQNGVSSANGTSPTLAVRRARMTAVLAIVIVAGFTTYGIVMATGRAHVERITVKLPHLNAQLNGTKIVQLTDLHMGPTFKGPWLARLVTQVNALQPDIVAITGDLVDGTVEGIGHQLQPLADLQARYGVYFVTGNHEYYSSAEPWIRYLQDMGIIVLQNEHVALGPAESPLYLAGVNDWIASKSFESREKCLEQALFAIPKQSAVVLLAHQPRWVGISSQKHVDLQLSGHTHGGQIFPWHLFVYLQQPYLRGEYRVDNTLLYVNRGAGVWGPPIRIGSAPEITEVQLQRDSP